MWAESHDKVKFNPGASGMKSARAVYIDSPASAIELRPEEWLRARTLLFTICEAHIHAI